ncbi:MAG: F510_1955 family glycosylhydrolase [Solirubrobacteraceae bacterium]
MPSLRVLALTVAAALAFAASGCGDDGPTEAGEQAAPSRPAGTGGLEHIHGLGVRGDTLYIATHAGLWAALAGQTKAMPVGTSGQDIMGFSVLGPKRFIGSGHPAPGQDQPPNLGLIESRDGGKSWRSISLLGEADFHVLESLGQRVYGFDGTQGRLMVSSDGGRSFQQRTTPAAMFSLAIDPGDPDRVVAATERGIFASSNAGRGWRPLREDVAGLLAWPAADRLYLVDGSGQLQLSRDGGRRWTSSGEVGGEPAAFLAEEAQLYIALADATVKRSADGGRSWSVRAAP